MVVAELAWLAVVRHGESTGNVAALTAETSGLETIDIPQRDADVPLSATGREQAVATGRWLAALPEKPDLAVVSPYLRAVQTAELATGPAGVRTVYDERLRDRELGITDLLTAHGMRTRLPAEWARRQRLGKFYYRPPGGESWADVALRLRGVLADLRRDHAAGRVVLFSHEAVVYLIRYLVEELSEPELVALADDGAIANCSISAWRRSDGAGAAAGAGVANGRLVPVGFNTVDHLYRLGVEPTREGQATS